MSRKERPPLPRPTIEGEKRCSKCGEPRPYAQYCWKGWYWAARCMPCDAAWQRAAAARAKALREQGPHPAAALDPDRLLEVCQELIVAGVFPSAYAIRRAGIAVHSRVIQQSRDALVAAGRLVLPKVDRSRRKAAAPEPASIARTRRKATPCWPEIRDYLKAWKHLKRSA